MPTPALPAQLGFRMPAEWEPHAATWFTWPRIDGVSFPGDRFEPAIRVFAAFIEKLVPYENVNINVWDAAHEEQARAFLASQNLPMHRIHFHRFPSYECWCRDHGPIFLVRDHQGRHERAVVDWGYNAWGNKYPPFDLDDAVPQHVAALRNLPLFSPGIVMEGGSLEVNGRGTLLTTRNCLLNSNRNPSLSRSEIEQHLKDYLGVTHILWLGEGIVGDDTDGHIDDITRFVNPATVVTAVEPDPSDPNHEPLRENLEQLRRMRDQDGNLLNVVELPMPGPVEDDGIRLPASYANFYIANRVVVVPTYRHANDRVAINILQKLFPDREVTGVDSTDLIWGLGSFHCISQQEPA